MKLNGQQTRFVCATLLALASLPRLSSAQIPMATEYFDRTYKTEVYGIGQFLHSDDFDLRGPYGNVNVKMDDTGLGGFGVAYHLNQFVSVEGEFMFGSATFSANIPTQAPDGTVSSVHAKDDAFIQSSRFNITYNMINRRLTPIVTAGIGYQYLETELEKAPPAGYCYWDPWYGWVCFSDRPHAYTTDFTWNAGAGFRWNVTDNFFIKAVGGANWVDYYNANGITTQIEGIFSIGWTF